MVFARETSMKMMNTCLGKMQAFTVTDYWSIGFYITATSVFCHVQVSCENDSSPLILALLYLL